MFEDANLVDEDLCSGVLFPSQNFVEIISRGKLANILYSDICSLQPMEIYVDDEAKLTLHGLVQVT